MQEKLFFEMKQSERKIQRSDGLFLKHLFLFLKEIGLFRIKIRLISFNLKEKKSYKSDYGI